jgi:hypothetical protein
MRRRSYPRFLFTHPSTVEVTIVIGFTTTDFAQHGIAQWPYEIEKPRRGLLATAG